MSNLRVDNITDELGTGAPDFTNGLTSNGIVGIGTSSPTAGYLLDVRGQIKIGDGGGNADINFNSSNVGRFLVAGTERMRIDSSNNVLVGKTTSSGSRFEVERTDNDNAIADFKTNNASGDVIIRSSGGLVRVRAQGTNDMALMTSGTVRMLVAANSNVGIANTAPAQTLTVDGTIGGTIIATQAEAEAGTVNTDLMTPLRVKQALAFNAFGSTNLVVASGASYTPSAGMKGCLVIATGGGGGGGGADGSDTSFGAGGSGGGAGGTIIRYYSNTEIGTSVSISIGAGGTAGAGNSGTAGGTGGTTTFDPAGTGTTLSATGGGAGGAGGLQTLGSQAYGAQGSSGSGGQFNLTGGDGTGGAGNDVAELSIGGNGGHSFWGGSGGGGIIEATGVRNGNSGTVGGGGGGGAAHDDIAGAAGGAGGAGLIFILEFI